MSAPLESNRESPEIEWRKIFALLDVALELEPAVRLAWLETLGPDHAALVPKLNELLRDRPVIAAEGFMHTSPALALAEAEAPDPPEPTPQAFVGPYRLLREIGQGGMASVWLAERADGLFERKVALKLPHASWGSGSFAERMARERRILASLTHPGIARLYDVGTAADGRPFLALEYVDGQPIDVHAEAHSSSVRERVALIVQVARAVAHAHARLVVHRDLKPSNILVDAQGHAHLLDFGIAKLVDPMPDDISEGTSQWIGRALTPDYASPEQIRGDPLGVGSDVYSLGVVAFELLAGIRPYHLDASRGAAALAEASAATDVSLASDKASEDSVRRQLRGDLDAILAHALAKSSRDRYATVAELADDLERYLRGEPVRARGRPRLYVVGRAIKRHRWGVGGAVLLVASLAVGLAGTLWQAQRAEIERDSANAAAAREEAVRNELTNLFRSSADQKTDGPMTARAMLDVSAKRVLTEYRNDSRLTGKVVLALADLYGALGDLEGESALLQSYLAQAAAGADSESVATAQQEFAYVEILRGHFQHAAELLPLAEATWASTPKQHQTQRLELLLFRGMLLREQGDLDGSIHVYQEAIAQRIAFSGWANEKTGDLYNSLAITLARANRLDEALAAYQSVSDIDRKLGVSGDASGLVSLSNIGMVDYRIGRLREAERVLKSAFEGHRERAGDSMLVAVSMGLYGATLTALGRYAEAIGVLRPATDMALKYGGDANPMAIQSRLFLTDALTRSDQLTEASALSDMNIGLARKQFGAAAPLTLRAQTARARIDLTAGRAAAADGQFVALVEPLRHAGLQGQPLAANALLGSGEALLAQGKPAEAVAPLRQALQLREQLHWGDQNWELALVRCRLGEALKRSRAPGGVELLRQGLAVLETQLGEHHPEVERARLALAQPA